MIVRYQLSFPIPSGILDPYSISVEADMNSSNPEETVHLNVAGAIATITLARPHLRNALDRKTMKSLIQVALDVSDRDDVRAVVIAAEGADFSVGADLKEVQGMESDGSLLRARRDAELGRKLLNSIREIHQPTVCALQGIATGGGACIAAACDFRIAASGARIGLGEVKVGMNLMWNALPLFVELVGLSRAKQMIMSGTLYSVDRLETWGLIDEQCTQEDLLATAMAWAQRYADLPPVAVQMIKRSVNQYALALSASVMHMDHDQWILAARSEDFRESISAFIDKRPATLTGR